MVASIFGTRNRRSSRLARSDRPTASSRHRTSKQIGEEVKPDADELRDRRVAYYAVPEADRRRSTRPKETAKSKERVKAASSTAARGSEHDKHRSRRHKSSTSGKAEKVTNAREAETDDYVYGAIVTPPSSTLHDGQRHRKSGQSRPARPTASKDHGLPVVIESEVTPDDSISQVAERRNSTARKVYGTTRPSLRRSNTTSSKLAPTPEMVNVSKIPATTSQRSERRDSSILGSLLRRNTTTAAPPRPRLVDCLTCGADDIVSTQSAKLACGHRMCHDCLKRVFEMSVKDPSHMPPKCCTDHHIPLRHVDTLFDLKFKLLWNRKYQEYHTKNRIYCPSPKCGEWIKPKYIHTSQGRKYAQCPRCHVKVCTLCNSKMHRARECPQDPEIAKLVAQAKEKGWQSCFSCNAMVELKEGCNHMTCRCTAEFCMLCGAKWKTCECPWFNYNQLPDPDRLNDMRIPQPVQVLYRRVFGAAAAVAHPPPPLPVEVPPDPVPAARHMQRPRVERARPANDDLEQRRRQERLDADLARRMQLASFMNPDDEALPRARRVEMEAWGLGNTEGHFMNEDFVENAAASGRRRRPAREARQDGGVLGLVPNFLGDERVLGAAPGRAAQ